MSVHVRSGVEIRPGVKQGNEGVGIEAGGCSNSIPLPQLLTVGEVASLLAMGESTVRKLISKGAIPVVRIQSVTRIEAADVHRFVEMHKEEVNAK